MYAFVHVPKTGGTNIIHSMQGTCKGHNRVSDYMKHDHMHQFITFVRDPYDVVCSGYYFVKRKRIRNADKALFDAQHMDLIWNQGVSVEEFLERCVPNHTFTYYYDSLTPKDFTFVGVTDDDRSWKLFEKITRIHVPRLPTNVNQKKLITDPYVTQYPRELFYERNSSDYELYLEGRQRFYDLYNDVYG
jgi:hypothetical protein